MKSLIKITVFLVLATGCGPDLSKMNHYKVAQCLNFYSDKELNIQALEWNTLLANEVMTKQGSFTNVLFSSTPTFCDYFKDTAIIVEDVTAFCYGGDKCEYGFYSPLEGLHLGNDGANLPHELFHVLNSSNCQPGTYWHENWDKNGYNQAVDTYNVGRHTDTIIKQEIN